MRQLLAVLAIAFLLISCTSNQKRVVVMSKGTADINVDAKTIKATDGGGHEEKTADFIGGTVEINLSAPAGESKLTLTENGLYVVNAKNDTIIGSAQNYAAPSTTQQVITQDALKQKIDSLNLLIAGKNVTKENRNFFLLPNTAAFITPNHNAMIVGPYHKMRSAEGKDGKAPEVYRFYSIKEVRETIARLQGLTTGELPQE
jgi:hypothetical protein